MLDLDNDAIADLIIAGLENGIPEKVVCDLANVPYAHFKEYITLGLLDLEDKKQTPHSDFASRVMSAKAVSITQLIDVIREDAIDNKNVKSAQWLLERMAKSDFGSTSTTKHEVSGKVLHINAETLLEATRELENDSRIIEGKNTERTRKLSSGVESGDSS